MDCFSTSSKASSFKFSLSIYFVPCATHKRGDARHMQTHRRFSLSGKLGCPQVTDSHRVQDTETTAGDEKPTLQSSCGLIESPHRGTQYRLLSNHPTLQLRKLRPRKVNDVSHLKSHRWHRNLDQPWPPKQMVFKENTMWVPPTPHQAH